MADRVVGATTTSTAIVACRVISAAPTPGHLDVHGYIALLSETIDRLQASRYSDGGTHGATDAAAADSPDAGDDA